MLRSDLSTLKRSEKWTPERMNQAILFLSGARNCLMSSRVKRSNRCFAD